MNEQRNKAEALAKIRAKKVNYDDVEWELIVKRREENLMFKGMNPKQIAEVKGKDPKKQDMIKAGYKGKYIQKRALIDQQLLDNNKAFFSYAHNKHMWQGEEDGFFQSKDLIEWYRLWNQTQVKKLNQIKETRSKKLFGIIPIPQQIAAIL